MDKNQVITYIKTLTDKQLAELFYEATEGRHPFEEEKEYHQAHFVMGTASRMLGDNDQWENWELSVICLHEPAQYPNGWHDDSPLVQFGKCCQHETSSYAKHAICAICKEKVYGT